MVKKIGLITSGGDSPGMNACIRAIVRTATSEQISVVGFYRGYEGLIDNDFVNLTSDKVSNIIHRGGTILKTARSKRFMTLEGQQMAVNTLNKHNLDGFIVIGGDGSFKGALALSEKHSVKTIGCPGTIDNDLVGTDYTIGYDTAINNVVDAIDKIRDTAESHDRIFVVEVMGRDAGLIALRSAIGSGAEAILLPERKDDLQLLLSKIKSWRKSKSSKIVIVAEGDESGGAVNISNVIKKECPEFDVRISILGHIQRGGNPTCMERVNASLMGYYSVKALQDGKTNMMVGIVNRKPCFTPFKDAVKHIEELNPEMLKIMDVLSS
jgi:6-phosphofructokinase 1